MATAPKPKPTQTSVTISVDAPDRKSLSRSQLGAVNRAQTLLAGTFSVSVEYQSAEQPDEEAEEAHPAEPPVA